MFWQPADGGAAERLTKPDPGTFHVPESWSRDGDVLLFGATKDFVTSLWTLSLKDRVARAFGDVNGSSLPTDATFSPDGRWVAYQTGTGQAVVEGNTYVQPFPPTGTKYQIGDGGRPLWSRDGKEPFFVPGPGRFMAVSVRTTERSFTVTSPVPVPRRFGAANPWSPRTFDILPDGRIVGVGTPGESGSGPPQIRVVLNWFEELKTKVPKKQLFGQMAIERASDAKMLVKSEFYNDFPAVSPDGHWMAYESNVFGRYEISNRATIKGRVTA